VNQHQSFFVDLYDDKTGHKGEMMFWEQPIIELYKIPKIIKKATLMCHFKGCDDR
jgi:hypothetical protein